MPAVGGDFSSTVPAHHRVVEKGESTYYKFSLRNSNKGHNRLKLVPSKKRDKMK